MENTCVICGAIIPEGRQVCPDCEAGGDMRWMDVARMILEQAEEKRRKRAERGRSG